MAMSCSVILQYDPVWQALTWAIKNCPSYSTNIAIFRPPSTNPWQIRYYFTDQKDAVYFALKWS